MEDKPEIKEKTPKEQPEEVEEEQSETKDEEKIVEQPETEKTGTKDKKKLKEKQKEEKEKEKPKRIDRGPDFKYIVRISNTDINGEKSIVYGLTSIKGIGTHLSSLVVDKSGLNKNTKMGDLTDAQIALLQETINKLDKNAPGWMLNHRKDYDTGKNFHFVGTDIDSRLRDEINIMKKIRCYRGIRHELGLRVRGQRTSSNGRKGLALGVSKKREPATAEAGGGSKSSK